MSKAKNIWLNIYYIKKEMMSDDPTLGEDKIINTVRKEYFVNNTYF